MHVQVSCHIVEKFGDFPLNHFTVLISRYFTFVFSLSACNDFTNILLKIGPNWKKCKN